MELIIVDEGSTDDTYQEATKLCQLEPKNVSLLKMKCPWVATMTNQILGQTNGKYLVRLDADDWLDECALLIMVSKLEQEKMQD